MVCVFLKKLGKKIPYDSTILLLSIYPDETKLEKDTCIPLFTAALFTIGRRWKQPRWIDKEVVVYIHNGLLFSHKKEHIWVSFNEVHEPRTNYTEWSESERETNTIFYYTYMKSRKMVLKNLIIGQQWRNRHRE